MSEALTFERGGAERHAAAASSVLDSVEATLAALPADSAGLRLNGLAGLSELLDASGPIGGIAARHLERSGRAVRALLFDKTAKTNWALGWHQDRTVAVCARREVPGFAAWNVKSGMIHVEPPFAIIEQMVTLRVHLDPVPETNAPLMIAPGSHRLGRIAEDRIEAVVEHCGTAACLADRGDVWAYATPIIHASSASADPGHRRVLQIDYSADELPGGLEWLGV